MEGRGRWSLAGCLPACLPGELHYFLWVVERELHGMNSNLNKYFILMLITNPLYIL